MKISTSLLLSLSLLGNFAVHADEQAEAVNMEEAARAIHRFDCLHIGYKIERAWYPEVSDEQWQEIVTIVNQFKADLAAMTSGKGVEVAQLEAAFTESLQKYTSQEASWVNHVSIDPEPMQLKDLLDVCTDDLCRFDLAFYARDFSAQDVVLFTNALNDQFMRYHATGEWLKETYYQIFADALQHYTK